MLDGQAVGANLCKGIMYIKHMHAVTTAKKIGQDPNY